ncbi:cupin domain-containing protein [Celerinatantimonas sp. YJH-8]
MKMGSSMAIAAVMFTGLAGVANAADDHGQQIPTEQVYYKAGTQGAFKGPEKYFTGDVYVQKLFPETAVSHYSGAYVTFEPGARSAWHEHPAGQHMIVTEGTALTVTKDGKVFKFHKGDAIWCPPGVEHWHGATADAAMTHLVITASKDGKNVIWGQKVTDAEYNAALKEATQQD